MTGSTQLIYSLNKAISYICAVSLSLIALFLALNLGATLNINYYEEQFFAVAVGCSLFIAYARPAAEEYGSCSWKAILHRFIDPVAAWGSLFIALYFAWNFENYSMAVALRPTEVVVGGVFLLVALFEIIRRIAGLPLVLILLVILAYGLWGSELPSRFAAPVVDGDYLITYVTTDPAALLGMPVAVAVIVVLPFLFMGGLLRRSGGGQFFTDICQTVFRHSPGGPAKVSIVSSSLLGTVSGSAVANVATSGVITIPMMKKAGYRAERASAIEAVASTGGQFVPPVMGAAAFLMAEFLQVPYADIAAAAILPVILFYSILFVNVHLSARYAGATAGRSENEGSGKSFWYYFRSGWHALFGLLFLFVLLLGFRWRPELAAFAAAAFYAVCGMLFGYLGKRISLRDVLDNFRSTGAVATEIIIISAAAGIIIGVLNFSGLTVSLSRFLLYLSFGFTPLLILYTAVAAIILGMGMPTTGVYVLLAVLMVPALIEAGLNPLASHFFIFYFGVLSMITPPVAMAAFAAASISGGKPMSTAVECIKFGWPLFLLPLMMVIDPSLLLANSYTDAALMFVKVLVAFLALAAGTLGYWRSPLSFVIRVLLIALSSLTILLSFLNLDLMLIEWLLVAAMAVILAVSYLKPRHVGFAVNSR